MRLIEKVDLADPVYLIPLGDLHLGSPQCNYKKFEGYVNWVKEHSHAYIFLMGDLFDLPTLTSPTSTFEQTENINEAQDKLLTTLLPVRDRIIGGITGNHEHRGKKAMNFSLIKNFLKLLSMNSNPIPYCKYSAVIRFRVGTYKRKDGRVSPKIEYVFYAHHTTGGGSTPGGKLNRVDKLRYLFEGADAYLGAHNHFKAEGEPAVYYLSKSGNGRVALKKRRIHLVDTGSFVEWNGSYAEEGELPPAETGAPRLRMNGTRKDLHVSY